MCTALCSGLRPSQEAGLELRADEVLLIDGPKQPGRQLQCGQRHVQQHNTVRADWAGGWWGYAGAAYSFGCSLQVGCFPPPPPPVWLSQRSKVGLGPAVAGRL